MPSNWSVGEGCQGLKRSNSSSFLGDDIKIPRAPRAEGLTPMFAQFGGRTFLGLGPTPSYSSDC